MEFEGVGFVMMFVRVWGRLLKICFGFVPASPEVVRNFTMNPRAAIRVHQPAARATTRKPTVKMRSLETWKRGYSRAGVMN
jgi:hypothetical protein